MSKGRGLSTEQQAKAVQMFADGASTVAVAEAIGASADHMRDFRALKRDTIARVRAEAIEEMDGVWIANKRLRLLAMQQDFEFLERMKDDYGNPDVSAVRARTSISKEVAEQLGQVPKAVAEKPEVAELRVEIVGVDPDKLT